MKILIAPDKFKGSLSARAVGEAISRGLQRANSQADCNVHPLADGGDGSLMILRDHLNLQPITVDAVDPLGRPIAATYYHNEQSAYIELASAAGLVLLTETEQNPLKASTYGVGLIIQDAITRGCLKINLFLGGSATNDLGLGIAHALGYTFFDAAGQAVFPTGGTLADIHSIGRGEKAIDTSIKFNLLCDVTNPLYGPNGAAHVFAAQKGASAADIQLLERGLQSSSALIEEQYSQPISDLPGGGAAGGVAAGLVGLFGATIVPGFAAISTLTNLEAQVAAADVVITGEGKLDGQSLQGKVVGGVAELCKKHGKPLHLFVGDSDLDDNDINRLSAVSVSTVRSQATDLADAMERAETHLEDMGYNHSLS
jgi:glycerate kinase